MKVSWEYSLETEALRLLHCAHQIAVGFYKINGFIALPYTENLKSDRLVSIPDLPYLRIPRFWEQVKRIDVSTLPLRAPTKLVSQTSKLLNLTPLPTPTFERVKLNWEKNETRILDGIFTLIPHKKHAVSKIVIMPTAFGTGCSFSQHRKVGDSITIWLRNDKGVAEIVEAILTALTRDDVYKNLGGLWQESEIIVDWLLVYSPLGKLLKEINVDVKNTLTIKNTRSVQNANTLQKSEEFMRTIGAPVVDINTVKSLPLDNFTSREREIFQLLLVKSPGLVTTDEIAEILFSGNSEAFSLYAISKTIQRLRDKLEKNGVSGSYIQTKRGEGYLLIN